MAIEKSGPAWREFDAKLGIPGGFRCVPDCGGLRREGAAGAMGGTTIVYCGGDLSSPDVDGGTQGLDDASSADSGDGDSSCGGGGD